MHFKGKVLFLMIQKSCGPTTRMADLDAEHRLQTGGSRATTPVGYFPRSYASPGIKLEISGGDPDMRHLTYNVGRIDITIFVCKEPVLLLFS